VLIKIQPDAPYADIYLLYMFRVSQHPSSGVLKTVTSGTGNNTGTTTSFQCGPIGPRWRLRLQFLVLLMIRAVTPETCRVVLQ